MDRMMKDKTSFWFDQISYDKIRNDYKRVEKDYNFYVQEKSITSVRKTKSQSPRKHLNVNTARKESDESPVQDLAKTMKSKPKALKTFAIEAELVMATSRATEGVSPNTAKLVRPRKNTINEPKTSEINLMSSKAIKDFINYDNYFGETEEEKSGALDIKLRINPTNSEFELDLKSESGLEKDDESSITGSTNYFGNNQDQNRNEIKVVDSLTINTFTKLSNFSDPLGRKLAFTVDWNYINRIWEVYHKYTMDIVFETFLSLSLSRDVLYAKSPESRQFGKSQIRKEFHNLTDNHNILKKVLLDYSVKTTDNSECSDEDDFFTGIKAKFKHSFPADERWEVRSNILRNVTSKFGFE